MKAGQMHSVKRKYLWLSKLGHFPSTISPLWAWKMLPTAIWKEEKTFGTWYLGVIFWRKQVES